MRIIAGKFKGHPLAASRGLAVRPTSDKARQALFNILGAGVEGGAFLDLFAGTGAVGLEALSRGAVVVTAVETHPETAIKNAAKLGATPAQGYTLIQGDIFKITGKLAAERRRFDFIFADPPWDAGLQTRIVAAAAPLLAAEGRLVLELNRRTAPPDGAPHGLALTESRRYGEAIFRFYQRSESQTLI
ncbi:MAG: RsmD family RNA methyltransferase [Nitrospinota bacterium]|nr:RsmD family RNA methyltransferase [Nitrospinota bacterium]